MSILFISDVHLSHKKPKIVNGFLNFLRNHAIKAQALYILGDLFEIWLGDDELNKLHNKVALELKKLKKKQIPCYFIHGNRDFLLGSKYANSCGMILLPNFQTIKLLSGKKIIILHGDSLCINDKSFLKLKKFFNCNTLQKLFLSLPFSCRRLLFNIIHNFCVKHKKNKSKKQLKIDEKIALNMLIQNQSEIMIHGHIHQPKIYDIHYSQKIIFKRIVLGCWDQHEGSVVKINEKKGTISLIKISLNTHS